MLKTRIMVTVPYSTERISGRTSRTYVLLPSVPTPETLSPTLCCITASPELNNFRVLFDLRAISIGVIITRCDELQQIFDNLEKGSSYGDSTTHMSKILPRIEGGGGGGCPILVFGISKKIYLQGE